MPLYAAVEGGGTKFIAALAASPAPDAIVATAQFPTTTPDRTLAEVGAFLAGAAAERGEAIVALGVASFGPVELDPTSPHYGSILATPKPDWSGAPVLARLRDRLGLAAERCGWETDVNAAALGELRWGAGRGADPLVYVTVGTGVGAGVVIDGRPLHGLLHPEIGHLPVRRARLPDGSIDTFPGHGCRFHGDCWEAMCTGPALAARTGRPAADLAPDDPVWAIEAEYLALGLASCVLALSPRRIVIGGGVVESRAAWLLPMVRRQLAAVLGGYIGRPEIAQHLDRYVVAPGLREPSPAIAGALALAGAAETARASAASPVSGPGTSAATVV